MIVRDPYKPRLSCFGGSKLNFQNLSEEIQTDVVARLVEQIPIVTPVAEKPLSAQRRNRYWLSSRDATLNVVANRGFSSHCVSEPSVLVTYGCEVFRSWVLQYQYTVT